jgi:hypothetical protein
MGYYFLGMRVESTARDPSPGADCGDPEERPAENHGKAPPTLHSFNCGPYHQLVIGGSVFSQGQAGRWD